VITKKRLNVSQYWNCPRFRNKEEICVKIEWKPLIYGDIDLSDKFLISNDGQLFSIKTNRLIKLNINKQGYYFYTASLGQRKKNKMIKIHRAVAFMFVNGYKKGLVVNHKDGNKTNNNFENLEWVTGKDNTQHALKYGLLNPCKPVICNQTQQIFKSIKEASEWCGLKTSKSIEGYLRCEKNRKTAGKHPITGEKLTWSYV
jgi:hypothetical protein